jgi:hypothetical protein
MIAPTTVKLGWSERNRSGLVECTFKQEREVTGGDGATDLGCRDISK